MCTTSTPGTPQSSFEAAIAGRCNKVWFLRQASNSATPDPPSPNLNSLLPIVCTAAPGTLCLLHMHRCYKRLCTTGRFQLQVVSNEVIRLDMVRLIVLLSTTRHPQILVESGDVWYGTISCSTIVFASANRVACFLRPSRSHWLHADRQVHDNQRHPVSPNITVCV